MEKDVKKNSHVREPVPYFHCKTVRYLQCNYLKHGEKRLGKVVKCAASGLVEVKFSPKELHAEQREYDDKEEEQEQQGSDGANRV